MFTLEEKRSRFIAVCEPVISEEQARAVLERIRAEHKTASHHVYAYYLRVNNIMRRSDDGEPQGTGGLPVLNVFIRQDIADFVCVVTRYFGGTLLGVGGLARAYGNAAKGALEAAGFEPLISSAVYRVTCDYSMLEQMKYFFNKNGILITRIDYGERCTARVEVEASLEEVFRSGVGYEITNG